MIEFPETYVFAEQINRALVGKTILSANSWKRSVYCSVCN